MKYENFFSPGTWWGGKPAPNREGGYKGALKPKRDPYFEGNQWLQAANQLYPAQQAYDTRATQDYGQLWNQMFEGAAPGAGALLGQVNQQVAGDLALGGQMSPWDIANIQNNVRTGQAARGFGYGLNDAAAEAVALQSGGQALKQQRIMNALGLVPINTANAQLRQQFYESQQPKGDPFNPYNADLQNTNLNMFYQNLFSKREKSAAQSAAQMGMWGDIIGGIGSAIGGAS